MRPRVHLCIAEADAALAAVLVERLVHPVSGLLVEPWSGRGGYGGPESDRVRAALVEQIAAADAVACIVGPVAHTDPWVRWELDTAVEHGRGIVAIRVRTGIRDFMPVQIRHGGAPIVDAHPPSVIAALVRVAFQLRTRPANK